MISAAKESGDVMLSFRGIGLLRKRQSKVNSRVKMQEMARVRIILVGNIVAFILLLFGSVGWTIV